MTSSLRKVVCMFRIKFLTKRIFRIFPILRTDGMAPFGTYLWNDPRIFANFRENSRNIDVGLHVCYFPWKFQKKCAILSDTVRSNLYCILHLLVAVKLLRFLNLLPFSTVRPCTFHLHIVCPSIRPSVTLVDHDHIGWKCWKLTARTISPTSSLFVAQRPSTFFCWYVGYYRNT